MREIIVTREEAGRRADKFLLNYLKYAPRSFVYKTLRKKNARINGENATGSEVLNEGDIINLYLSDETIDGFSVTEAPTDHSGKTGGPLKIIYEDENIIIIDKPAGLLSQPAGFFNEDSAVSRIKNYLNADRRTFSPAIINRLDRNTSGLIVAAKNLRAAQDMALIFRGRMAEKSYLAAVFGNVTRSGRLEDLYVKDEKNNRGMIIEKEINKTQKIITEYKPLFTGGGFSVIEVNLFTGLSHQIRAHMQSAGHPVIGDPKYGNKAANEKFKKQFGVNRQMLHAWKLKINIGGENNNAKFKTLAYLNGESWTAEPPGDLDKLIDFVKTGAETPRNKP